MDIQLQRTTQMASELTEEFKLKIIYIDIKKKKKTATCILNQRLKHYSKVQNEDI